MKPVSAPTLFVTDDNAAVRASVQGPRDAAMASNVRTRIWLGDESDWLLAVIFSVKERNSTLGSDRSRVRGAPVNQKPRLFEGIEVQ
jgi:hypothetical protein